MSHADDVFIKNFGLVLGFLIVFAIVVFMIGRSIGGDALEKQLNADSEVAARIKPVGQVATSAEQAAAATPAAPTAPAPAAPAETAATPKSPDAVYQSTCFACHGTGAAGAPKLDDKANWETRIAQGMDKLVEHATNGKGAMPPKGGTNLSAEELKAVIEFMLNKAGVAG